MWKFVHFSRPSLERQCVIFTEAAVVSPFNSTAKVHQIMPENTHLTLHPLEK